MQVAPVDAVMTSFANATAVVPLRHAARVCGAVLVLSSALATPVSWASEAVGAVQQRVREQAVVRVCIWPDYYGITYRSPRTQQLTGLDIELSAELARDLGVKLQHVDSSFVTLIDDLKTDRCDVAMFAVGMLPQRMQHLKFTRPYMQSGIFAVTTKSNRAVRSWADIDQPGVVVAVQAGTFMEPVMAAELKKARMVSVRPPATRERELEAGRVDVFMTDFPYSRRLLDNADWATLISPPAPFHVLPYAYATKPGDDNWLRVLDSFVQRIQKDGRLEKAARQYGLTELVVR